MRLLLRGALLGPTVTVLLALTVGAAIVERIAAVVNGEIIFLTDIERHFAFFESAEGSRFSIPLSSRSGLSPSLTPPLKEGLQELIDLRLLAAEARRFGAENPGEAEVDKVYKAIQGGFPGSKAFLDALQRYATSPEDLKEEIRMRILVDRFVDQRIRFFIFVTPDDTERYFEENREKFSGKTLQSVREKIQNAIIEERARVRLKEYTHRLRSRAEIRINL